MEFIRNIFDKFDGILGKYLQPLVDKLITYLQSEEFTIMAVIGGFVCLLVLIGLLRWLRKQPKLFIFIVIILGLVVAAWHFSK